MNKRFSKIIKIGKLSISLFPGEIVFVYIGSTKVHVKTLYYNARRSGNSVAVKSIPTIITGEDIRKIPKHIHRHRRKLAFALGIVITGAVILASLYPSRQAPSQENMDEEMKESLLRSAKTDFSSPVKGKKLVITQHVVSNNETIHRIAKRYGVSIETILGANGLNTDQGMMLRNGMVLKIPNKDGILLRMPQGAPLASIASKYKVSLPKIIEENNISNPDFVAVGTTLFIPDAKPLNLFSGFLWPTAGRGITCGYGWRRNPFDVRFSEFHPGIDMMANYEWIKSSKYGQVTFSGWLGGYGIAVIVAHPGGWKTLYAHLSRSIVRVGQYVKQGQLVGLSGSTGRSTGPHLHFEILKNGAPQNPFRYLLKRK